MNKKLMAVAVAGALAAPGLVLAQVGQVQLYGNLNLKLMNNKFSNGTVTAPTGATAAAMNAVTYNPGVTHWQLQTPGNNWGIRGSEDLGGGLTAFFQLQATVATDRRGQTTDSGSATFAGDTGWIGLRGSWGQIRAGFLNTPYKDSGAYWNVGAPDQTMGVIMGNGDTKGGMPSPSCGGAVSATGLVTFPNVVTGVVQRVCTPSQEANTTAFTRMAANSIEYQTPNFSGFVLRIANQIAEDKEVEVPSGFVAGVNTPLAGVGKHDPSMWSYALDWSGGPFRAGIAYERHVGFRADNTTASVDRNATDNGIMIGGQWNFGPGAVGLGWERLKYGNSGNLTGQVAGNDNSFTLKNWILTGRWNVTQAGYIGASYAKTAGRTSCGNAYDGLTAGKSCNATGAKMWSLGYTHSLSKRTSLYALYTKIDNEANINYYWFEGPQGNNVTNGSTTAAGVVTPTQNGTNGGIGNGVDVSSWGVGVRHTF